MRVGVAGETRQVITPNSKFKLDVLCRRSRQYLDIIKPNPCWELQFPARARFKEQILHLASIPSRLSQDLRLTFNYVHLLNREWKTPHLPYFSVTEVYRYGTETW